MREAIDVAGNVRIALARQNMSRSDLARRLGVGDMWVSRRLNGQTDMSVSDLTRIADALGVTPASLLPERQAS